ncbi:YicC family protein [Desulfovibrio aminophilus]|nr:YicC/YloC family endoribonuclease [Desulfovibrio aminophilus]MCM0756699.1 YicC family protein [Desulfovibrio aminophilus]
MPASMTGFGRSESASEKWSHGFEVKSVNGRFLDVKWRIPSALRSLETAWEKVVRSHGSRGRVDVSLNLEVKSPDILGVSLNLPLVAAMLDQVAKLAEMRGQAFEPDYNRLLSMSSLWRDDSSGPDPALLESLERGLRAALEDWRASRQAEGAVLAEDLRARLARLRALAQGIAGRIPTVLAEKRAVLCQRVREALTQVGAEYSEDRMLQEVAVLTDRLDVSEELTRLFAHLDRLEQTLSGEAEEGKRLDFLIQEAFREINTCGNKAQDVEVSRLVVDFKTELERCREQVQNLE